MVERIQKGSETLSYISSPEGLVAMHISDNDDVMKYVLTDYLETIYALVDDGAQSTDDALYYSFNAWGERRELQAYDGSLTAPLFSDPADYIASRGYTGHEHIDAFDLINMNGRAYDPVVGAFLSPDPYVQAPDMPQNLNRYAYCVNNPLKYSDPSGEFITWSFSNGGFSIGFNLTPIGIPLGAGINIGWGDGASLGGYGEVGYRVGGTGFGSGITVSQSLDYNFKHSGWSTTTAEGAYASLGPFNAGINFSQTYDMSSKQWSNGWGGKRRSWNWE